MSVYPLLDVNIQLSMKVKVVIKREREKEECSSFPRFSTVQLILFLNEQIFNINRKEQYWMTFQLIMEEQWKQTLQGTIRRKIEKKEGGGLLRHNHKALIFSFFLRFFTLIIWDKIHMLLSRWFLCHVQCVQSHTFYSVSASQNCVKLVHFQRS